MHQTMNKYEAGWPSPLHLEWSETNEAGGERAVLSDVFQTCVNAFSTAQFSLLKSPGRHSIVGRLGPQIPITTDILRRVPWQYD